MNARVRRRNRNLSGYFSGQKFETIPVSKSVASPGATKALQQLIYASRPFGYDASLLAGILSVARIHNAQNEITGALICRPDPFIQLLEGPTGKVETLFEKIARDDRHVEVRNLVRSKTEDRLFPEWAMKHDPADSWMWSPEDIHQGALDNATAREVRAIFVRSANYPEL